MRSPIRNSRGVALILTILIVSLIVAFSIQFNRDMGGHLVSARSIGHGVKALYAAKSGISCAFAVLMEDPREVDTLFDDWAIPEYLNSVSAGSQALLTGGGFMLQIEDLSGKIQINQLIENTELEQAFRRFLELEEFGLDHEQAETIADSVMDWIDTAGEDGDDLVRFYGAEDDYYMSLERPYHCKNGPLDSPEELLLVNGMTPELFYGTEDQLGIAPYISVFGDGEININTADPKFPEADPLVLACLHDEIAMTRTIAEDMANYRADADEDLLSSSTWYKEVVPDDINIPAALITTVTKHFLITSIGYFGDVTKRIETVVQRENDGFKILSWKTE